MGIDEYEDPAISRLRYAEADASAVARALQEQAGFPRDQIFILTSRGKGPDLATSGNILFKLETVAREVRPGDTFVFYFSGHGVARGEQTYLLGRNTDARSETTLRKSAVQVSELKEALKPLKASRVLFVMDACRDDPTGGKSAGDNPLSRVMSKDLVLNPPDASGTGPLVSATLFSCGVGQRSYEWPARQQGFFSYFLVQGLRGEAVENRRITVASLARYLGEKVPRAVRLEANRDQEPWVERVGPSGEEIVLVTLAPEVRIQHPAPNLRVTGERVRLVAQADGEVTGLTVSVNGVPQKAAGSGVDLDVPLQEGENVLAVTASGPGGSGRQEVRVTREAVVREVQVEISSPSAGLQTEGEATTVIAAVTGGGTLDDVTVSVNGRPVQGGVTRTSGGAAVELKVPLDVGDNTIAVRAVNGAGVPVLKSVVVRRVPPPPPPPPPPIQTRKADPPVVRISSPAAGSIVSSERVAIGADVLGEVDEVTVWVNGAQQPRGAGVRPVPGGAAVNLAVDLREGENTISVQAVGPGGPGSQATTVVRKPAEVTVVPPPPPPPPTDKPPSVRIVSPTNGQVVRDERTRLIADVTGDVTEVSLSVNGVTLPRGGWLQMEQGGARVNADLALAEGENTLVVSAVGPGGPRTEVVRLIRPVPVKDPPPGGTSASSGTSTTASQRRPSQSAGTGPTPPAIPPPGTLPVPAGGFQMGSNSGDEKPIHTASTRSYYLGRTEVTNAEFRLFVEATGHDAGTQWKDYARRWGDQAPVVCVSWYDAAAYCKWKGGRLPTEAEWEKAARGTTGRVYPWGSAWNPAAAWWSGNSGRRAQKVGTRPQGASEYGFQDMAGNVWEWTSSAARPYPYAHDDREYPGSTELRIVRGGSWDSSVEGALRTTNRLKQQPQGRYANVGFRLAWPP